MYDDIRQSLSGQVEAHDTLVGLVVLLSLMVSMMRNLTDLVLVHARLEAALLATQATGPARPSEALASSVCTVKGKPRAYAMTLWLAGGCRDGWVCRPGERKVGRMGCIGYLPEWRRMIRWWADFVR